jgi:hypothetical protein
LFAVLVLAVVSGGVLAGVRPDLLSLAVERVRVAVGGALPDRQAEPAPLEWETLDPVAPSRPAAEQPAAPPAQVEPAAPVRTAPDETPRPAAAVSGRLFVNARPWGQLYIDGRLIGNTPQPDLALTPGVHTIRVERDGFVPFEREVRIGSGQVVRLTDIELEPITQ